MTDREKVVKMAYSALGVVENSDKSKSHPYINRILKKYIAGKWDDSVVYWCSLFVLDIFDRLGIERGFCNGLAASWLSRGNFRKSKAAARQGDLAIYKRSSWSTADNVRLEKILGRIKIGEKVSLKDFQGLKCHIYILLGVDYHQKLRMISGNDKNSVRIDRRDDLRLIAIVNPYGD